MPKFFYTARDKQGNKNTGFEEASSTEEVVSRLQAKGLLVVKVAADYEEKAMAKMKPETGAKGRFYPKHYRITSSDLVLFCRQLATLLGAGVTILRSLDIISQQVGSRQLYSVIKDLERNMEAGLSFHEAMHKHKGVFSELWINLIESGEASGSLAVVLSRLAGYLEADAEFKRKVISALIYPLILFFAGIGALFFMTIKIIPTFANIFQGFKVELPALTKLIIAFSNFVRTKFLIIIALAVAAFFALRGYAKTKEGRKNFERISFNLPLLGELVRAMTVEKFASEMSTLLESGVPILYSMEIAEHSVDNSVMAEIINNIKEGVRGGKSLREHFEKSGFFDPMVVQMVGIGEEIGELPQMFKRISTFYAEYAETFLQRFVSMFEPAMLIFMGGVIGILVVGMFLPIFQIAKIGG